MACLHFPPSFRCSTGVPKGMTDLRAEALQAAVGVGIHPLSSPLGYSLDPKKFPSEGVEGIAEEK